MNGNCKPVTVLIGLMSKVPFSQDEHHVPPVYIIHCTITESLYRADVRYNGKNTKAFFNFAITCLQQQENKCSACLNSINGSKVAD